jgi:hypothetical protein
MEKLRDPHAWAIAAPLLCAVHCAATPLFVLFLPALALTHGQEAVLLGLSAVVALMALVPGIRVHGRPEVFIPLALGVFVWGAALAHWLHPIPEPVASSAGHWPLPAPSSGMPASVTGCRVRPAWSHSSPSMSSGVTTPAPVGERVR